MPTHRTRRRAPTRLAFRFLLLVLTVVAIAVACTGPEPPAPSDTPVVPPPGNALENPFFDGLAKKKIHPGPREPSSRPNKPPVAASLPDDVPIEHVVFVIKENRTFDHFFGTYPGADGTTVGTTFDGETIPLSPATDVMSQALAHGFWSGLYSVDAGRMDGFDLITGGDTLVGYSQFDRSGIPHYWKYADRFVLADKFFTSEYGPTFPEHLYTIAAQSNGIMDNKAQIAPSPGRYCDDRGTSGRSRTESRTTTPTTCARSRAI